MNRRQLLEKVSYALGNRNAELIVLTIITRTEGIFTDRYRCRGSTAPTEVVALVQKIHDYVDAEALDLDSCRDVFQMDARSSKDQKKIVVSIRIVEDDAVDDEPDHARVESIMLIVEDDPIVDEPDGRARLYISQILSGLPSEHARGSNIQKQGREENRNVFLKVSPPKEPKK